METPAEAEALEQAIRAIQAYFAVSPSPSAAMGTLADVITKEARAALRKKQEGGK